MTSVHLQERLESDTEYPLEIRVKVYESERWADWVDFDSDPGFGHGIRAMFEKV